MSTTLSELANTAPNCPHLLRGHCQWLSARLGRPYPISKIFCQFECRNIGPFEGNEPADERTFLVNAWWRRSPLRPELFAERVIKKYESAVDLVIPSVWPEIKRALAPAEGAKGFSRILLTGSIIVKHCKPPKDLDIVICMNDLQSALDLIERKDILPQSIAGIPCDYFIYLINNGAVPDLFFVCLDPERQVIYPSRWFELKVNSIPPDAVIQPREPEQFDEVLKAKVWQERNKANQLEKRCASCNKAA